MAINFLLVLLFSIKEANNDQQGQIGNGDEHANVEEGKNSVGHETLSTGVDYIEKKQKTTPLEYNYTSW